MGLSQLVEVDTSILEVHLVELEGVLEDSNNHMEDKDSKLVVVSHMQLLLVVGL